MGPKRHEDHPTPPKTPKTAEKGNTTKTLYEPPNSIRATIISVLPFSPPTGTKYYCAPDRVRGFKPGLFFADCVCLQDLARSRLLLQATFPELFGFPSKRQMQGSSRKPRAAAVRAFWSPILRILRTVNKSRKALGGLSKNQTH